MAVDVVTRAHAGVPAQRLLAGAERVRAAVVIGDARLGVQLPQEGAAARGNVPVAGRVEMAVEAQRPAIAGQFHAVAEVVALADAAEVGVTGLEAEDALVAVAGVDDERRVGFGTRAEVVDLCTVVRAADVWPVTDSVPPTTAAPVVDSVVVVRLPAFVRPLVFVWPVTDSGPPTTARARGRQRGRCEISGIRQAVGSRLACHRKRAAHYRSACGRQRGRCEISGICQTVGSRLGCHRQRAA